MRTLVPSASLLLLASLLVGCGADDDTSMTGQPAGMGTGSSTALPSTSGQAPGGTSTAGGTTPPSGTSTTGSATPGAGTGAATGEAGGADPAATTTGTSTDATAPVETAPPSTSDPVDTTDPLSTDPIDSGEPAQGDPVVTDPMDTAAPGDTTDPMEETDPVVDPMEMPMDPEPIVPSQSGSDYSLALSDVLFTANGNSGRITGLDFGGTNLLTDTSVNDTNYGSSFWTAPQTWTWPPALDAAAYEASIDAATNTIVFTSEATELTDGTVSVEKRFSADAVTNAIVLEYTVTNEGSAAISVAPWEVTRVRSSGYSFYPTGSETTQEQMPMTEQDGVSWLDYDNAGIADEGLKNIGDGAEGWLAHVDDGVLFLKLFDDIPAADKAPNEGEIEIYAAAGRDYVELEQQGSYESIAPGATSASWKVRWLVRAVPADVDVSVGSAGLVQFVRDLVAAAP